MSRGALVMLLSLVAGLAFAQRPPQPTPTPTPETPIDTSTIEKILSGDEAVEAGGGFTYDPAGRRDPFRSLLERQSREDQGQRPPNSAWARPGSSRARYA